MTRSPLVALSLVAIAALAADAAAQTLYRYVDANGRVVYSDQPPPPSVKDAQTRQLPENVIETDPRPLQARQAADHFPVTLYTFDCDVCREAQALLVKRGIPFQTVIVTEEAGAAKLKAVTGKQSAPVLTIGDKEIMQGYNEQRWQAMLDEAGYPRSMPTLPHVPARVGAAAQKVASEPAASPQKSELQATPQKTPTEAAAAPEDGAPTTGPGTGYPK
ncbi:MAG TPA: glutaredoxin family protein [Casimicrobiaceae bacterium]|jgi:glutaredoxin|nr:glutaredoxin family protein [Casimicrobiaceae bacterium]